MKTTTKKTILILIFVIPVLFLSGCEDADWDLLEIAFESWAEENNIYENGEWQPEGVVKKAVEKTSGDINNQKEFIELDGLDVVRDIEEADALASEALTQNDLRKMRTAVDLRPNDWRLQEQNAVLWSVNSQSAYANDAFVDSNNLLKEQIQSGSDCIALRRQQLEYRENLLSDNIIIPAGRSRRQILYGYRNAYKRSITRSARSSSGVGMKLRTTTATAEMPTVRLTIGRFSCTSGSPVFMYMMTITRR